MIMHMDKSSHAYTRHSGSQSETPMIAADKNGVWYISGYQVFQIDEGKLLNEKPEHKIKIDGLCPYFPMLKNKSFVDFGCSSGYFGIQALLNGASSVTFVDHDHEYLRLANQVVNVLNLKNCNFVCSRISKYRGLHEVGFVFALVHWIYSYSDNFGSLDSIVDFFSSMVSHTLFIEWVDPADYAMQLANHIEQNKYRIKEPYTKDRFISALNAKFPCVRQICQITHTRELYIATHLPL